MILGGSPVLTHGRRVSTSGASYFLLRFRAEAAVEGTPVRLARYGAWLRRHSLDELPVLFNVAAGSLGLREPIRSLPTFGASATGSDRSQAG